MRAKKIRNLTPHPVIIITEGIKMTIPRVDGDPLPRVSENVVEGEDLWLEVAGAEEYAVPTVSVSARGTVSDLPEPEPGTILIVSRMVAEAVPHRRDLFFPANLVRDENGRIIGCAALGQTPDPATE